MEATTAPPHDPARPRTVLVTGATGFIGRKLVQCLLERGDTPIVAVRDRGKARRVCGAQTELVTALDTLPADRRIDAIVNLAGEPIASRRWTARRKARLIGSRLAVTSSLLALVERLDVAPRTWINASAIGYYGVRDGDEPLHEKSRPQDGFQSQLCREWERTAAEGASRHGVKVAVLRLGLVLGRDGGALPVLARPVRLGVGAVLGDGRQWVSWIHVDDLIALFLFVLDEGVLAGPLNATAPEPVRHADLMRSLAATLHRRLLPIAVPARALRPILGELSELFVGGQRVVPQRAAALGFDFRYPTIDVALEHLFGFGAPQ